MSVPSALLSLRAECLLEYWFGFRGLRVPQIIMEKAALISLMCHSSANIRALHLFFGFSKAFSQTASLPLGIAIKSILGYLA